MNIKNLWYHIWYHVVQGSRCDIGIPYIETLACPDIGPGVCNIVPDIGFNIGIYWYRDIMSRYRVLARFQTHDASVCPGRSVETRISNLKYHTTVAGGPGSAQAPSQPDSDAPVYRSTTSTCQWLVVVTVTVQDSDSRCRTPLPSPGLASSSWSQARARNPFPKPIENVALSAKWNVHIWNWLRKCSIR